MKEKERKARLNENLKKAMALNRIANSKDYTEILLPYLKKLAQIPYIDPTRFKTQEEFIHALKSANARVGAYTELITFLSQQEVLMEKIRESIKNPPKSYEI